MSKKCYIKNRTIVSGINIHDLKSIEQFLHASINDRRYPLKLDRDGA